MYNLTSWGYLDCYSHEDDGAYGGVLTRLLYRALPEYYPATSSYARFPFVVPSTMERYLEKLVDSPVKKYEFDRPKAPVPVVLATQYDIAQMVLTDIKDFRSGVENKLRSLLGPKKLDINSVHLSR